jgi:mannose-6-phosphate isomerase-like protein (cupin superfamily)
MRDVRAHRPVPGLAQAKEFLMITIPHGVVHRLFGAAVFGCALGAGGAGAHDIVAVGPEEGTERWLGPDAADDLGAGARITIKVDRVSVPYTSMMVAEQRLAADGIPVHAHVWEDEVIYVLSGEGAAIVGPDQQKVPIESGTTLYIPMGSWHGLLNGSETERLEALFVTTPVKEGGLGDFFRNFGVKPGHPPMNLPPEEFVKVLEQYGMVLPPPAQ